MQVQTCSNLPQLAPACSNFSCLLRHASACPLSIILKYIYKFNVRNGVGAIMFNLARTSLLIGDSKTLLQSATDPASCCLKVKTLHQTFCQLKSDKIIDGKKRRMFLLNKHSRPQSPRSFWSAPRIETSGRGQVTRKRNSCPFL